MKYKQAHSINVVLARSGPLQLQYKKASLNIIHLVLYAAYLVLHICKLRKYDSVNLFDSLIIFHRLYLSKIHTEKSLRDLSQVIVGGHSTCPPFPQTLLPNIVDKTVRGCRVLCASTPSCLNHIIDKSCKGTKSSRKSDSGPCNISTYFFQC